MSRGYQPEDQLDPRVSSDAWDPNAGDLPKVDVVREQRSTAESQPPERPGAPTVEARTVYELRGRTYRLRNSEVATMVELGKFRALAKVDLKEFVYGGSDDRMRPDVENLARQGLVAMKSIPHEETGSHQLLTLTKNGHRFLTQTQRAGRHQALYHGFAKPREAHHDADLYRLYQRAAKKIESQGGRNLRVVLDYELKKRVYHDLARLGPDRVSAESKRAVAEQHGLQVGRGKIPLPDVRIEYDTQEGERARVDLELATGHYRGRTLAEKVRAGFSLYARADDVSKLKRVLDQQELTAEILSL